jgi:SH3-like domain-containing protein
MKLIKILLLILSTLSIFITKSALSQHSFSSERSLCTATLVAEAKDSRINLRSGPGTNYRNLGYGLVGDFVYVLSELPPEADVRQDDQGYLWYRVGFPKSGAVGWIRKDFLMFQCAYD